MNVRDDINRYAARVRQPHDYCVVTGPEGRTLFRADPEDVPAGFMVVIEAPIDPQYWGLPRVMS